MNKTSPVSNSAINTSTNWQVGEQVLALWQPDNRWYPATIQFIDFIDGDRIFIIFSDDKVQQWTSKNNLMPFNIAVGSRVYCKWRGGAYYYLGTITQKQGEKIYVKYDDGDVEWTTVNMICITSDLLTESHPYMKIFTWATISGGIGLTVVASPSLELLSIADLGYFILGIMAVINGFRALIGTKNYTQLSTADKLTQLTVFLTTIIGALLCGVFIVVIFSAIGAAQENKRSRI